MPYANIKPDFITNFFASIGNELTPDWLREELEISNKTFEKCGPNEFTAQYGFSYARMNLHAVAGFILLCVRSSDYFHCTSENPGFERCFEVRLVLSNKSKTKLVPHGFKVLNMRDFDARLKDIAGDIKRHVRVGGLECFDEILDLFANQVTAHTYQRDFSELSDDDCLDIYENFLNSLEEYGRKVNPLTSEDDEGLFDDLWDEEPVDFSGEIKDSDVDLDFLNKPFEVKPSLATETTIDEIDEALFSAREKSQRREKIESHSFIPLNKALSMNCNDDANQLIEQITFMMVARGFERNTLMNLPTSSDLSDKKGELPRVTEDIFLASLLGSSIVLDNIAVLYDIKPVQIRFPDIAIKRRKALGEIPMIKKTITLNGFSDSFFHHATAMKYRIEFDTSFEDFAKQIFIKKEQGDAVEINYEHIARLLNFPQKSEPAIAFQKANSFKRELNESVVGQTEAVTKISELFTENIYPYHSSLSGTGNTITLLGASSSGKSLLAEKFVSTLQQREPELGFELVSLSMEDYTDDRSVLKLIGSGSQYVDSTLGYLTLTAEVNPRTCFVFENFDKAHQHSQDVLLSLIEKGVLRDNTSNRNVSFKQCFFIFTTTSGSEIVEKLYA